MCVSIVLVVWCGDGCLFVLFMFDVDDMIIGGVTVDMISVANVFVCVVDVMCVCVVMLL